jgi:type II secretory pathway component GspD/PulD (secretin)
MNKTARFLLCLAAGTFCLVSLAADDQASQDDASARTIHLKQDDGQIRFDSRVYELKNVTSESVLPFVNSAIQRYNRSSTIRRVTAIAPDAKDAILVSTGKDFLPYVDEIVAALDRPGQKGIQGTGVARIAYTPKYRAAQEFSELIDKTLGTSVGKAYVNEETNTIFWRDQTDAARGTLDFIESELDRPLPQVALRLNYYELRDSDLKDWGFDYLAWKNGPGVNLLNLSYNAGRLAVDQVLDDIQFVATSAWGYGGFFTAPQFDMSFIRCLQQSGNAAVTANVSLTMVNTPVRSLEEYALLRAAQESNADKAPYIYRASMEPEYQNIAKNVLGRTFVGKSYYEDEDGNKFSNPPALDVQVINPFICLPQENDHASATKYDVKDAASDLNKDMAKTDGCVMFDYSLFFKDVVERGNTGAELSNNVLCAGAATLGLGREKVLTVYEKENDVEQTIGLPILCRIPVIKYLFSTVTHIKERTYVIVTAEAVLLHPEERRGIPQTQSVNKDVKRRIENPFRASEDDAPKAVPAAEQQAEEESED